MASTVYNGTNLLLKFIADGGTLATIGHSTSATLSLSMDARRPHPKIQMAIRR